MHIACKEGHLGAVKMLQAHGTSIDAISEVIK